MWQKKKTFVAVEARNFEAIVWRFFQLIRSFTDMGMTVTQVTKPTGPGRLSPVAPQTEES